MVYWKSTNALPWLTVAAGLSLGLLWLVRRPLVITTPGQQPLGSGSSSAPDGFEPLLLRSGPEENGAGGSLTAAGIRADLSFRVKPEDRYGNRGQEPVVRLWNATDGEDEAVSLLTDSPLVEHIGSPSSVADALIQMVELDTNNSSPEVLFSQYSGGAHCCALVTIFRQDGEGYWQTIDVGAFDGEIFAATEPIPGQGYLLANLDNRFLYRFSSYAGSSAPPQFLALQGNQVVDVSDRPALRPLFEEDARRQSEQLVSHYGGEINGLLAGYAASYARVGRIAEAWPVVLERYDRQSPLGLEYCPSEYDDYGNCHQGVIRYTNFPDALAALLRQAGYISEDLVLATKP